MYKKFLTYGSRKANRTLPPGWLSVGPQDNYVRMNREIPFGNSNIDVKDFNYVSIYTNEENLKVGLKFHKEYEPGARLITKGMSSRSVQFTIRAVMTYLNIKVPKIKKELKLTYDKKRKMFTFNLMEL